MKQKIEELFGADLRSLAVFRIGLAIILLVDLALRATSFITFYTDEGVLPRTLLLESFPYPWRISIYLMSGSSLFVGILFLAAAIVVLLLLFGWHTRLAAFFSWFFLISLHVRNPMVLHSGDYLLRSLLFWSIFLPLGARYSMDHLIHPSHEKPPKIILSMGTVAVLGQVVFVYLFAAVTKWGDPGWLEGRAVYQALNTAQYVTQLGVYLLHCRWILKFLSYTVLWFETFGPIFLFTPFYTGPIRTAIIFGFFCLQLGFGLFLNLGLFPWIASVAMLPFLPSWFWDRLSLCLKARREEFSTFTLHSSGLSNLTAAFFFVYVFFVNVQATFSFNMIPQSLSWIQTMLFLDQAWYMFSPPDEVSNWFIILGEKKDGSQIDLFKKKGVSVDWEKPALASKLYKNIYWYKYLSYLWSAQFSGHLPHYAWNLCRTWNDHHKGNDQIKRIQIYGMYQRFYPKIEDVQKILLWTHNCFAEVESQSQP